MNSALTKGFICHHFPDNTQMSMETIMNPALIKGFTCLHFSDNTQMSMETIMNPALIKGFTCHYYSHSKYTGINFIFYPLFFIVLLIIIIFFWIDCKQQYCSLHWDLQHFNSSFKRVYLSILNTCN